MGSKDILVKLIQTFPIKRPLYFLEQNIFTLNVQYWLVPGTDLSVIYISRLTFFSPSN